MIPANRRIWIVAGITDMRLGLTSLSGLVQTSLEQSPLIPQAKLTMARTEKVSRAVAVLNMIGKKADIHSDRLQALPKLATATQHTCADVLAVLARERFRSGEGDETFGYTRLKAPPEICQGT